MGMDYYDILKVSKTATDDDLRRAYKKLAMRWHPDKHPPTTKPTAESKFKQICQAYDVLIHPTKRHIYDLYGHDALLSMSSSSHYYNVSSPTSFRFDDHDHDHDCKDMFDDDELSFDDDEKKKKKKADAMENKLMCSLEELYKGCVKKLKISRLLSDLNGKPKTVEESLSIDIKAGWKKGTKITFPEKGNQEPGLLPGDLIFVIEEKPHPTFKRDGNDLVFHYKLSLLEALTGKKLNITTLDGRNLNFHVSDIVKPGHEMVIPNEGMPISKEPTKKGNLRIKFEVKFPSKLTSDQKADLKRVLGGIRC